MTVTLLCSGVALGVYVPALLLEHQLRTRGLDTEVVVLENLLLPDKKAQLRANKRAFHGSFAVALAGQKLARPIAPSLDPAQVAALTSRWRAQGRRRFLLFSGFWLPLVEELASTLEVPPRVDLCFMDAATSVSWRVAGKAVERHPRHTLFESDRIRCTLDFSREPPPAWEDRADRLVVHGGGWGMGTYREIPEALSATAWGLDVVAYEDDEVVPPTPRRRTYRVDPAWNPWDRDASGRHTLPPFGELGTGRPADFSTRRDRHGLFELVLGARAIVSKPGGATLLDSLASATPLVTLAPFGDYEQRNADLWQSLGLGLPWEDWAATGFSVEPLRACSERLLAARAEAPSFVDLYLQELRGV
jgi:hypothetical protein